ncbi:MAG: glycine-rich SFCGS family protein [Liquorilactobacillus nagelii]|uniref:SFCGS family glycine-rich protein n=1 Tax=Liquorilactobacillus nagelii TaxID=82688 RepID=UPI0024310F02|nr:SFCGS family glycine-rich protein [Liquorilactobacillus nagelii]MCI1921647.1 glycine-rich SFCGS family protein [Liquorilactobacillus nagelii]MCI1976321.1 glycine-rich SFCGS family protein [Liquorilactobacillus nagelii]
MIKVIVADRMGKGQKVVEGLKKGGLEAEIVPGIGADMRLGDEMKKKRADFGISFCGSGGAGAITANSKYGYPERHGMRSIQEGITAIEDGKKVLGFGFMDKIELGEKLAGAIKKKYPELF